MVFTLCKSWRTDRYIHYTIYPQPCRKIPYHLLAILKILRQAQPILPSQNNTKKETTDNSIKTNKKED